MLLTPKQVELLVTVATLKNADGKPLDLDELAAVQSYPCTKGANRFRVRSLVKSKLIVIKKELRKERVHSYLELTELGWHYVKPHIRTLKDILIE